MNDLMSASASPALMEYRSLSGKTLQKSIEGEMSGPLEELLVAIGTKHIRQIPPVLFTVLVVSFVCYWLPWLLDVVVTGCRG